MSVADIILSGILLWAGWKGFSRGLVIEVASLAALLLGIYAAFHFSWIAAPYLEKYVDANARVLHILSLAVTFLVVVLLVILVGKLLEKVVNLVMLGFVNKILGAVFSVLKVAVVLSVLMLLLNLADPHQKLLSPDTRQASWLYPRIEQIAPALLKQFDLSGEHTRPPSPDVEA